MATLESLPSLYDEPELQDLQAPTLSLVAQPDHPEDPRVVFFERTPYVDSRVIDPADLLSASGVATREYIEAFRIKRMTADIVELDKLKRNLEPYTRKLGHNSRELLDEFSAAETISGLVGRYGEPWGGYKGKILKHPAIWGVHENEGRMVTVYPVTQTSSAHIGMYYFGDLRQNPEKGVELDIPLESDGSTISTNHRLAGHVDRGSAGIIKASILATEIIGDALKVKLEQRFGITYLPRPVQSPPL